jgi:hypothetical protein
MIAAAIGYCIRRAERSVGVWHVKSKATTTYEGCCLDIILIKVELGSWEQFQYDVC